MQGLVHLIRVNIRRMLQNSTCVMAIVTGFIFSSLNIAAGQSPPSTPATPTTQNAAVFEDLSAVKTQLKSTDATTRYEALNMLEKASSPEADDLLIKELNDYGDARPGVPAERAIQLLGIRKAKKAVAPLVKFLTAGEHSIRVNGRKTTIDFAPTAAQALGQIADDAAAKPLITVLSAEYAKGAEARAGLVWCCAEALGRIGDPKGVKPILGVIRATSTGTLRHPNSPPSVSINLIFKERRKYYDALQNIHGPETTAALLGLISNPPQSAAGSNDPEEAAFVLKTQKDPAAVKPLIDMLQKFTARPAPKNRSDELTLQQQIEGCASALAAITGQATFDTDAAAWNRWYAANAPAATTKPATAPSK